jgi:hypothetical protein
VKYTPIEVSDIELAFGGDMEKLLPAWDDIPSEFKKGETKWNQLFNSIFFRGEAPGTISPVEGIDPMKAGRHIRAIMSSFQPKHEHKEAGCAYLMSLWFQDWNPEDKEE